MQMLGLDELGRCNTMQYKSRGAIAILCYILGCSSTEEQSPSGFLHFGF